MIETTGKDYGSGTPYCKFLTVGEAKLGKTAFLVSQILGVFPTQKHGAVVDKPENLHVLAFDESALVGLDDFIMKSCKATDPNVLNYKVYNFQKDVKDLAFNKGDYDFSLYNNVVATLQKIKAKTQMGGVHAVVISSLTGLAGGIQRGIFGPPADNKGQGDQNKWGKFSQMISEIRSYSQSDNWHCFFEAHLTKKNDKDSIQIQGSSGDNFAFNVGHVFRVRRIPGSKVVDGFNVNNSFLETAPTLDFISGGRMVNERLQPQENDLTNVLTKLGMKVGNYGRK